MLLLSRSALASLLTHCRPVHPDSVKTMKAWGLFTCAFDYCQDFRNDRVYQKSHRLCNGVGVGPCKYHCHIPKAPVRLGTLLCIQYCVKVSTEPIKNHCSTNPNPATAAPTPTPQQGQQRYCSTNPNPATETATILQHQLQPRYRDSNDTAAPTPLQRQQRYCSTNPNPATGTATILQHQLQPRYRDSNNNAPPTPTPLQRQQRYCSTNPNPATGTAITTLSQI
ncbi:UNVERIFIED_CONTAM: hypothetical protein FKN15_021738 [Acipenser sinensis]